MSPSERITDGKVETYTGVEAGNVVPAAAAGVVKRVQADAHVETDDNEVGGRSASLRPCRRSGLGYLLGFPLDFSIRGLYFAFTGGLLCAAVLLRGGAFIRLQAFPRKRIHQRNKALSFILLSPRQYL